MRYIGGMATPLPLHLRLQAAPISLAGVQESNINMLQASP